MMTYIELLHQLQNLSKNQLNMNVTVLTEDGEFQSISDTAITVSNDILDEGHFYLYSNM